MKSTTLKHHKYNWREFNGTHVIASTLGVFQGIGGIEHGFFEMLQGNVAPTSLIIDAIGPEQELWSNATEPAMTIIPNFFITGIFAMIIGLLTIIWVSMFIKRKYSAGITSILLVLLLLTGGGAGMIFIGPFIVILITRINKPLTWWRNHLSINLKNFLIRLWPWSLIIYVIMNSFTLVVTIIGWPFILFFNEIDMLMVLYILGNIGLGLMVLAIISAIAYDIKNPIDPNQEKS